MTTAVLILRLEAPLQAWGLRARWDVRDTGTEPSKSGVIGMLGCALGYGRGDPELEKLSQNLRMAVREEQPGRLVEDYQTIGGKQLQADGTYKRAGSGKDREYTTIVSPRDYLMDARFLVLLEGPVPVIDRCEQALRNPVWPIYLGRKCCVPTRPVLVEKLQTQDTLEVLLGKIPWEPRVGAWRSEKPADQLRCIVERPTGLKFRSDEIQINPLRLYNQRRVDILYVASASLPPYSMSKST